MLSEIKTGLFYGGQWVQGRGPATTSLDPSTAEPLTTLHAAAEPDLHELLAEASRTPRRTTPVQRAELLLRVAQLLRERRPGLAELIARDGGLPLSMAGRDVDAAARYFEFYAAAAQTWRGESIPLGPGVLDLTEREPYGTCLVLLPFNFPLQLAARDCAPALAAGNAVVLKAPEQAPLAALALAALCHEAGAEPGLVSAVTGDGAVGELLVRHPLVDHVTFTGSHAVGRRVMSACADLVKPVTMELGGKSPHVVFADADLDAVTASLIGTTMRTAGQACSAGTRLLVQAEVHQQLLDRLLAGVAGLQVGRAVDDADVGPLVSAAQRDAVLDGVERGVAEGAVLRCGPDHPGPGFFVAPTVLDQVAPGSHVEQSELFGPVLGVSAFGTETEAVERANGTDYGLVAGVWTRDLDRAVRVARQVRAGQVFVNTYGVGSGVELPFGGVGGSGFGRVKGLQALQEYSYVKNIQISYGEEHP